MHNIQMVDLYNQYQKNKLEFDNAIQNVIETNRFINGQDVKQFSDNLASYLQIPHVIPCANGTDALQVALMALGLKPGDEIIVPSFTFISPVEVIALLGLTPVFVDVDENNFNLNISQVEDCISEKTKAIIAVHLYGQCANMTELMRIAEKYGLYLIEDNAQSIGSDYYLPDRTTKKSGTIGHIGCTSFFPSKNLGCFGDGGAIFTHDDALAEILKSIVNHGTKKKYFHERIGVNSRLDTLQAAILNVKLKYLDDYIKHRQNVASRYDDTLKSVEGIEIPSRVKWSNHVFHQYTIKVKNSKRDALKAYLQDKNIPSMVYYPKPLHVQEAFLSISKKRFELPSSEKLCETVLSLPMHTELSHQQIDYILENIIKFYK